MLLGQLDRLNELQSESGCMHTMSLCYQKHASVSLYENQNSLKLHGPKNPPKSPRAHPRKHSLPPDTTLILSFNQLKDYYKVSLNGSWCFLLLSGLNWINKSAAFTCLCIFFPRLTSGQILQNWHVGPGFSSRADLKSKTTCSIFILVSIFFTQRFIWTLNNLNTTLLTN